METRNLLYDLNAFSDEPLERPVISIGNITVGGTGKTPLVERITKWFVRRDRTVAILTRGYGQFKDSNGTIRDDEALPPELKNNSARRILNPDRVEAGREALASFNPDVFLLDDGFQHRQLRRDLDIVLLTARNPTGNGLLLPGGPLREPLHRLGRADLVVLSHADRLSEPAIHRARKQIREHLFPGTPILPAEHKAERIRIFQNGREVEEKSPEDLQNRRLFGFCGIGSPDSFRHSLEKTGAEIIRFRSFPDHHSYTERDISEIRQIRENAEIDATVTTRKDAVKIRDRVSFPLHVLEVTCRVTRNRNQLLQRLEDVHRFGPELT